MIDDRGDRRVGVVLAGWRGARRLRGGCPVDPAARAGRPRGAPAVVVGTSVGALNTGFLAATAQRPIARVVAEGQAVWRDIRYGEVLAPLLSGGTLQRGLRFMQDGRVIRSQEYFDPAEALEAAGLREYATTHVGTATRSC